MRFPAYNMRFPAYSMRFTAYSMRFTAYSMRFTASSMRFTASPPPAAAALSIYCFNSSKVHIRTQKTLRRLLTA